MRFSSAVLILLGMGVGSGAWAQHVVDTRASVVDVTGQPAVLRATTNPAARSALKSLPSCVKSPMIPAPVGRMNIPHHYLKGSNGPTNPAEAAATRVYEEFERRVSAGANAYVATGAHAEAACAMDQLAVWADAKTLLNYDRDESSQAWFQVEWTLGSSGISYSVLVNDKGLDEAKVKRVGAWLNAAAHRAISLERPGDTGNNHHYWRAQAAVSVGVATGDDKLFKFGVDTYKEAIGDIDERGALPKEMARHENAIHYQGFALQPLVLIAQFADRQGLDLYGYTAHGRSLRDAIVFFGMAVENPKLVLPYTQDAQKVGFGAGDFADFVFYVAKFGTDGLPASIVKALKSPAADTRIGGVTVLMAAK